MEQKTVRVYCCEDTPDALFTAVYMAYASRYGHRWIRIEAGLEERELELFSEYLPVTVDQAKAESVARSVRTKISPEAFVMVFHTALSNVPEKGTLIYRFLVLGFTMGSSVTEHLTNPVVRRVFEISRNVGHEAHQYLGFLRFRELPHKFLYAVFEPNHDITELVIPHFAERFMQEAFFIFDKKRGKAAVHPANGKWFLTIIEEKAGQVFEEAAAQEEYEELWKIFFEQIAILERTNPKLQRGQLALHFRKHMTEFLS